MLKTTSSPQPDTAAQPLHRLTTQYVATEDRLRLAGQLADGQACVLWLTQRLANRALGHLLQWLEQRPMVASSDDTPTPVAPANPQRQTELQRFAQQSAAAGIPKQEAVAIEEPHCTYLVDNIDLTRGERGVRLVFKPPVDSGLPVCSLTLGADALRQWVTIVYRQYRLAGWNLQGWPEWMKERGGVSAGRVVH